MTDIPFSRQEREGFGGGGIFEYFSIVNENIDPTWIFELR
jgi:hypothetical protein